MTNVFGSGLRFGKVGTVGRGVALAAMVATGSAVGAASVSAAPVFTLDPSAVGLAGTAITADTLTLATFSTVKFTGPTTGGVGFTQTGFLPVVSAFNGPSQASTPGLGSAYSLYFSFTATGVQSSANVTSTPTTGTYSAINLSLIGSNGPTTFAFDAITNDPFVQSGGTTTTLATGAISPGGTNTVGTDPVNSGAGFAPRATVTSTILPTGPGLPFFAAPTPFYGVEFSTFINLANQVTLLSAGGQPTGFQINSAGGGTSNFEMLPVPEPLSMALLGTALVGLGVARRRNTV